MNVYLGLEVRNRKTPEIVGISIETTHGTVHEMKWEKTEKHMDFIGELEYVLKDAVFNDADETNILQDTKIVRIQIDDIRNIEAAGISVETQHDIYFLSAVTVLEQTPDAISDEGELLYAMAM